MENQSGIKTRLLVILSVAILILSPARMLAQTDRITEIEQKLQNLALTMPTLNETVDVSVSGVSIQEFLRAVATNSKVNISVDPGINLQVVNNFSNVRIIDMLIFMAVEYDLDIKTIGNIISVAKYEAPKIVPVVEKKKLNITYDPQTDNLSLDLNKDSLDAVAREITRQSGKNIILGSGVIAGVVNSYIQNQPFEQVLGMLAYSNDLQMTKTTDGFYVLDKKDATKGDVKGNQSGNNTKKNKTDGSTKITIEALGSDSVSVLASNASIETVIREASHELGKGFSFVTPIEGNVDFNFSRISFEDLLTNLFNGTDYTWRVNNGVYLLGDKKVPQLRESSVLTLQYRTVEKVMDVIPSELKKDVEIKEFPDLNSLLLTGTHPGIIAIENFVRSIDKVVPVVLIEVMIVDVTKKYQIMTGIDAGLGDNSNVQTNGSLYPGLDLTLSTSTINDLINSFNGFGWFNLGNVTPNFYLSIKALEENGILKVRSTPKLSTMNGHEATLSIGKTEYYLEEQNSVIGTQNPQNITTRTYKSVNADLSITIKPIVSGDDQVTMDIKVKQSDFTARISPSAPPGSVTRNFESLVRVRNGEMVLLGGLEEKSSSNTGSGVPLLSRIPVIKWLFSSRSKQKSSSRLNIFIKPTVIY